jgi:hypothetical protein
MCPLKPCEVKEEVKDGGLRLEARGKILKIKVGNPWENGKTSSEHEWSKKYVHGLLAGFPGGTLKNFG